MFFLKAGLALLLLIVLLVASTFFWQIRHRKYFVRARISDESTLSRLIVAANNPSHPSGTYASRFSDGRIGTYASIRMLAGSSPSIHMAALLQSELSSVGGVLPARVRTVTLVIAIAVSFVAFLVFSFVGLTVAVLGFAGMRFIQLSGPGQSSGLGQIVRITDVLYAWHKIDPHGVTQWLTSVPGCQPAYSVLKSEVFDKESG